MIDISDGLAADLAKLCTESRCGATLRGDAIPISDDARMMADNLSPLDHALGDGEDFELLFAVSPEHGAHLIAEQPVVGIQLSCIGECTESELQIDGAVLEPRGWVHRFH